MSVTDLIWLLLVFPAFRCLQPPGMRCPKSQTCLRFNCSKNAWKTSEISAKAQLADAEGCPAPCSPCACWVMLPASGTTGMKEDHAPVLGSKILVPSALLVCLAGLRCWKGGIWTQRSPGLQILAAVMGLSPSPDSTHCSSAHFHPDLSLPPPWPGPWSCTGYQIHPPRDFSCSAYPPHPLCQNTPALTCFPFSPCLPSSPPCTRISSSSIQWWRGVAVCMLSQLYTSCRTSEDAFLSKQWEYEIYRIMFRCCFDGKVYMPGFALSDGPCVHFFVCGRCTLTWPHERRKMASQKFSVGSQGYSRRLGEFRVMSAIKVNTSGPLTHSK